MMSQVIRQETMVFFIAVGHGAMLALFYDFLRALQRIVPHGPAAVSAEDFLYWLAAGFLTFCLLFLETDGEIRAYVAVGIGLGAALYLLIFSRYVMAAMTAVFGTVRFLIRLIRRAVRKTVKAALRLAGKILSFVWIPARKLGRRIVVIGRKVKKNLGETAQKLKKRIEFIVKRVYNRKRRAEKGRKKAGRRMHRQYEQRGSFNDSGRKKARRQEQSEGDAGHFRRGGIFAGGIAGAEPEAGSEE